MSPSQIDTLVVDGPLGYGRAGVLFRDPAVAALGPQLASSYSLFLDDIDRPAVRESAQRWERELGIRMNVIERIALAAGTSDDGLMLTF